MLPVSRHCNAPDEIGHELGEYEYRWTRAVVARKAAIVILSRISGFLMREVHTWCAELVAQ